jgi:ferredoxin
MRVTIDEDRCQGHGGCFSIAEDLFESDELGNGAVVDDGQVPAVAAPLASLAVATCPEGAVALEED